ncbi:MAG: hypothetical protein V1855_05340 [bacterium]
MTNIIDSPSLQTKDDLFWLHHLLELCYYFAPLNQPVPELFKYLFNYSVILNYKDVFKDNMSILQKVSVVHFLTLTGTTKTHSFKQVDDIKKLFTSPTNYRECAKKINEKLELIKNYDIKQINNYIESGIKQHPLYPYFKTFPACFTKLGE